MSKALTIALPKGRLLAPALGHLKKAGIEVAPEALESRRLEVPDATGRFSFLLVKGVDVPTYVEYGVADLGIAGWDVIWETGADVLAPLDLLFGACRLSVCGLAGPGGPAAPSLRVATKYPRITLLHFNRKGIPVEVVRVSGSVEVAPLIGLAPRIVDLVDTGRTLASNGLCELEVIATSTARVVLNAASFRLKLGAVQALLGALEAAR